MNAFHPQSESQAPGQREHQRCIANMASIEATLPLGSFRIGKWISR
jgi:hypothetical protein